MGLSNHKATGPATCNGNRAVRFPVPAERPTLKARLIRVRDLLTRRWRRVVIHGQHYWLPG